MIQYILRRLFLLAPTLLGVFAMSFLLMHLVPGDPASVFLGENATTEQREALRTRLGLDEPLPHQFANQIGRVVKGDLGTSIFRREAVATIVARHLPATLELALSSVILATILGLGAGTLAAIRQGSLVDLASMFFAQLAVSMPVFWLGILLMAWLAVSMGWFPAVGRGAPLTVAIGDAFTGRPHVLADALRHLFLPALTLGLHHAAVLSRLVRASLLETLHENYVRFATAKGLSLPRVLWWHALRNALLPVVSVFGVRLGTLLGGSVLTESVFGWPGLGQVAITAISQRDLPLVQGIILIYALLFLLLNLIVDLSYGVLDPRVSQSGGEPAHA